MPLIVWVGIALISSYVLSAATMKRQEPKAATLDDFDVPQVADGTPQAVVFGEGWIDGWQVLWYGRFRTTKIKSKGGKK